MNEAKRNSDGHDVDHDGVKRRKLCDKAANKQQEMYLGPRDRLIEFNEERHYYSLNARMAILVLKEMVQEGKVDDLTMEEIDSLSVGQVFSAIYSADHEDKYASHKDKYLDKPFMSVTTVINEILFDDFPGSYKISPLDYISETTVWKISAIFGTLCHNIFEDFCLTMRDKFPKLAPPSNEVAGYFSKIDTLGFKKILNDFLTKTWAKDATKSIIFGSKKNFPESIITEEGIVTLLKAHMFLDVVEERFRKTINSFKTFFENPEMWKVLKPEWEIIQPEYICFSNELLIAGSIDVLAYSNRATNSLVLIDWKTNNKELEGKRQYTIKRQGSPFYNIKKNLVEKYYCQLHTYANIIERHSKYNVSHLVIVHVSDKGVYEFLVPSQKSCPCFNSIVEKKLKQV